MTYAISNNPIVNERRREGYQVPGKVEEITQRRAGDITDRMQQGTAVGNCSLKEANRCYALRESGLCYLDRESRGHAQVTSNDDCRIYQRVQEVLVQIKQSHARR
ncbi:hypothetical protein HYV86_05035 [Candidatus Woesearchaeota archaeon]|nr:hypothetical protein [Candidatus Woesearchaeota archaeon]